MPSPPLTFRRPAKSFSETRVWRIHLRAALFQAQGSDITNYTGNVPELHHKTAPSRSIAWHESILVIAEITATRNLPLTQLLSTETSFTHHCCNKAFDKLLTILIFFFLFVIVSCSLFLIIVTQSTGVHIWWLTFTCSFTAPETANITFMNFCKLLW